jgi:hypothetical protein
MPARMTSCELFMEILDKCFKDGKYEEAIRGLEILRRTNNKREFHVMIDNLIQCCKEGMKS